MANLEKKLELDAKLPKASIDRIVQSALPAGMSIAKDLRPVLLEYGVSFVQYISIGAYDMCEKKKKKTITPEHIMQTLSKFGFDGYVKECEATLGEYQNLAKKRPSKRNPLLNSRYTMEELLDQQEAAFRNAREDMDKSILEESTSD